MELQSLFDSTHFFTHEADVASNSLTKTLAKRETSYRKQIRPLHKNEKRVTKLLTSESHTAFEYNRSKDRSKPLHKTYNCIFCNIDDRQQIDV